MIVNNEDILPVKEEITVGPPSKKVKSENEAASVFHIPQDKFTAKLPDPFPLPTNFPPKVMYALEAKALLPALNGRFYGVLARVIYAMKCYPTPEYRRIGQQIIEKYPFLKSPVGVPYVSDQQGGCVILMQV